VPIAITYMRRLWEPFIDDVGQTIRHNTVCRHLGVMTPQEIQGLRERYGLTQAQFNQITGVGEASQSRWENGAAIQTRALDNYLFLLDFPENLVRLRTRRAEMNPGSGEPQAQQQFRCISVTDVRLTQQRRFLLRPCTSRP